MSEIEIGDYIRTKTGKIDKVIIEYNGKCNNRNCNCKHVSCKNNYYDEEDIVKHSKNIIDLIEVGDIVEIRCQEDYSTYEVNEVKISNFNSIILADDFRLELTESDIISILTKEQYNEECYRLED